MGFPELIFYGSLLMNFVLVVALFFRTALNKVVRDWWTERRQRRTEEQDRLHQLHKHLGSYSACHFSLIAQLIMLQASRTTEEVRRWERKLEEVQEELKRINEFMTTNELRFSNEIRSGLGQLRSVSGITEIVAGDYASIPEIGKRVNEACDRLKEIITRELGRR